MTNFKTTDIILAAYLKLSGYNVVRIEKQGQKGTFIFDEVPSNIISNYDLGNATVEPISFNNEIKQLTTCVRRME